METSWGIYSKTQEKDSEEEAIKEGVEQGEGLCNQVGMTLGRIIDIEEVVQD